MTAVFPPMGHVKEKISRLEKFSLVFLVFLRRRAKTAVTAVTALENPIKSRVLSILPAVTAEFGAVTAVTAAIHLQSSLLSIVGGL